MIFVDVYGLRSNIMRTVKMNSLEKVIQFFWLLVKF